MFRAVKPGLFTTIQDEGRWGYQAHGMPVAGVMDRYAYRVANLLAANRRGAAVLEMAMQGGAFEAVTNCLAAVCGADMQPSVDGTRVPNWSSFRVPAGSVLSFDYARTGCRTYLAVHGGIEVPCLLGSKSTYTRAGVGGLQGRPLREGDVLRFDGDSLPMGVPVVLPEEFIPRYNREIRLGVILGPQDDMFTAGGVRTFLESRFAVTNDADRMGYRLSGPRVEHKDGAEIISDALPVGAVQVPAHGMPIVMMADRQTTGGYPKIATVIGPCLSRLAQARFGDTVRFFACSDREAVDALRAEERRYMEIHRLLNFNSFSHMAHDG